jgi:hypothetical protein
MIDIPSLTIEQQFSVRSFQSQVQDMSRDQAIDLLIEMYAQMIWQQATYTKLIGQKWGILDQGSQPNTNGD